MPARDVEVVRRVWSAAARGDIDEIRALLDLEVRWFGADEPEGGCFGRDHALAFLQVAQNDGVSVDVLEVHDAGLRVVVILQTRHPAGWGEQPERHGELVHVRDGRIVEMVVYPDVDSATRATQGLGG